MAETKLYKPAAVDMPTAGKNYLLYLNVGTDEKAGAKWLLLGGQRSGDLSRKACLLYTSPSPRDRSVSRMPSSA